MTLASSWRFTHYTLPSVLAVVLSVVFFIIAWRRRRQSHTAYFSLLMVAIAIWSFASTIEMLYVSLDVKLLWARIGYIGVASVPTAWLCFTLDYTGRVRWLTKRNLVLLSIMPVTTMVLVWTNAYHSLFWSDAFLNREGTFNAVRSYGFWAHAAYSYSVISVSSILQFRAFRRAPRLYRRQATMLFLAAAAPWIGNVAYVSGLLRLWFDPTPLLLNISAVLVGWSLYRFRFLDVLPAARDAVIENLSGGVIALDRMARIVDVNPAAQRILQKSASQLVGVEASEVLPRALFDATNRGAPVAGHEEITVRVDDEERHFDVVVSFVDSLRGLGSGYVILFHDVTLRRRAEQALRGSEARSQALVNAVPDELLLVRPDQTISDWRVDDEPRGAESKAQPMPRTLADVFSGDVARKAFSALERAVKTGTVQTIDDYEVEIDGKRRHFEARFAATGDHGALIVIRDTTQQRSAEEERRRYSEHLEAAVEERTQALRRSEATLAEAQRIACIGNWEWDLRSGELRLSDEALRLMGSAGESHGCGFDAFVGRVHPGDREDVRAARTAVAAVGASYAIDFRIETLDGVSRVVHEQAEVGRDESGALTRVVGTVQDITEQRALERQLRQAQKMEAVGRLAGGVAHDFNNLLTVIQGYGELLLSDFADSDPRRERAAQILHAGTRASSLTQQLLAFSRMQVLEPRVLDLNESVVEMEGMLRRLIGEDIELVTALDQELSCVEADPSQIQQVVLNLAINARDAMPSGGRLTIHTKNVDLDESFAAQNEGTKTGEHVVLEVTDTGDGIDPATIPHLFEPFFTTKEQGKGTGLGLATVYGVVKQSGGYIRVASELGTGTTFQVYLPRVHERATPQATPPVKDVESVGSEVILVAEDQAGIRDLVASVLRERGYEVLTATDGADALHVASPRIDDIELLITDVVMPRMSGAALARHLSAKRPGLPVLYLSGHSDEAIGQYGTFHTSALLKKPFAMTELATKVRETLDRAQSTPPSERPNVVPSGAQSPLGLG